jgi:AbrB family looped-hinge helix DNA binding protein
MNKIKLNPNPTQVLVKGYMRPDKTSYTIVIPKEIRDEFNLKGGEYFIMLSRPELDRIILKPVKLEDTKNMVD